MRRRTWKSAVGAGLVVAMVGASAAVASVSSAASARVKISAPASSSAASRNVTAKAATGSGIVPPQNPSQSLAPNPNFTDDGDCAFTALDNSDKCNSNVVLAINNARATLENMSSLSLNLSAFETMTVPEQLFVIANLERTDRGLSPLAGLTTQLDNVAQTGAADNGDPDLTSSTLTGGATVNSWGSNWGGGTSNALGSDYYWMYDDGPNSSNGSCTTSSAAACWGHRDNILGTFTNSCTQAEQYMGAGDTASGSTYGPSFAEIIVGACGATPSDVVFTWAQAQQELESGGGTTTTTTTTTTTSTTTTTTSPTTTTTSTTTTTPVNQPTVPGTPREVTAVSSIKKGVVVTWEVPTNNGGAAITGYKIFRARSAKAETLYRTVTCTSTTCTFTNTHARSKTMFFYTVAAVNRVGTGPNSSEVSAVAR
jgi:hypothetical protein